MKIQKIFSQALTLSILGSAAGCAFNPVLPISSVSITAPVPEGASGYSEKSGWMAKKFMVATAHPLATDAGYQILKAGGSAVDASVAVQMVLGLVEPQSSGIGGGAFLLHFDGRNVKSFDGRETAPASVNENLFRHPDGKAMEFMERVVGGRSVGTPGVLRMLEMAHKRYGKLPWAELFVPAIRLAEDGFSVTPRLHALLKNEVFLRKDPASAAYFYDQHGKPWPVGHLLKNPDLAKTLREIAMGGADTFYSGRIATDIAEKVKSHPVNPGGLTVADIGSYQAKLREPICFDYKIWSVCGVPPPSSGGIAIAQMMGILEAKGIGSVISSNGELDAQAVHLFSEAGRLAFADRDRYVADTDFVPLPGNSVQPLLDKNYLAIRASLITEKSMNKALPGNLPTMKAMWGTDTSPELPSTSHFSIVDADGHAVAMTTSIESAFGARQMVDGFLLNNQLTDFSFDAFDAIGPIANRVQPGKRPRSAMSPTFVFEKASNKLVLVIGSPGGSAIINYVGKVLIGMMNAGLNVQEAISLPNFGSRNGPTELEQGRVSSIFVQALRDRGHDVRLMEQTSGLQGIMRMNVHGEQVWFGGADPRREGSAKGD